jgi:hypothetical protein
MSPRVVQLVTDIRMIHVPNSQPLPQGVIEDMKLRIGFHILS